MQSASGDTLIVWKVLKESDELKKENTSRVHGEGTVDEGQGNQEAIYASSVVKLLERLELFQLFERCFSTRDGGVADSAVGLFER